MMPDRIQEIAAMQRQKGGPKLGQDGPIPAKYQPTVRIAVEIAWRLNTNPAFVDIFRDTVAKLSGKSLSVDIFAAALNKMTINCADHARSPQIAMTLKVDKEAQKKSPRYQVAPAYSFVDGSDICEP